LEGLPEQTPTARIAGEACCRTQRTRGANEMNSIIYLVGLVVIVLAVLSFVGIG
jgi:hypothetical protein